MTESVTLTTGQLQVTTLYCGECQFLTPDEDWHFFYCGHPKEGNPNGPKMIGCSSYTPQWCPLLKEEFMSDFSEGQRIQFMHVSTSGRGVCMSTREGKFICEADPDHVKVLYRKKVLRVKKSSIRTMQEKSPVNDVFQAITKGVK